MISAIKSLFTSEKIVDSTISGLDKAFFTSEEKADNFHILLKLYEPFKIAQRILVLTFCPAYMICFLITFGMSFWRDIDKQVELLAGDVGTITITIILFYFGGGLLEGAIDKFKSAKK